MSYNNDDNGREYMVLGGIVILIILFFSALTFPNAQAEEHDLEKDCYMNMSQKQVVVCLKSMKVAVEDMTKKTKQLLADVKPVKVES